MMTKEQHFICVKKKHAGILLIKNGPRFYGCPLVSTIYGWLDINRLFLGENYLQCYLIMIIFVLLFWFDFNDDHEQGCTFKFIAVRLRHHIYKTLWE